MGAALLQQVIGSYWCQIDGRRMKVSVFPIGIDTEAFAKEARAAEKSMTVKCTLASLEGRDLIIGVDRLDYSKGLKQRIQMFCTFLEPFAAGGAGAGDDVADHAKIALGSSRICPLAARIGGGSRPRQWQAWRCRLDSAALHQQDDEPLGPGRALSYRADWARDAVAYGMNCREGICGGASAG